MCAVDDIDDASTFVVSTGRCGSTLVSNMVRLHPSVLSLSELFVNLLPGAFPAGPVSGPEFWEILSRPRKRWTSMLRLGVMPDEMLYPLSPTSRFDARTGVPPILIVTLPHLTDAHEALFDELAEWVVTLDTRMAEVQCRRLFGWLCRRFGRRTCVERSGNSLEYIDQLIARFPDARFVHLYRDGRDCAISMSHHSGFKLSLMGQRLKARLGIDPYSDDAEPPVEVPRPLRPFMPGSFDRERFLQMETPLDEAGRAWSRMVTRGCERLAALEPDRVLSVAYETLVTDTAAELRRLARFVGVSADDAWLERAAALVRRPASRWAALPGAEQERLWEACEPGMRLLYGSVRPSPSAI